MKRILLILSIGLMMFSCTPEEQPQPQPKQENCECYSIISAENKPTLYSTTGGGPLISGYSTYRIQNICTKDVTTIYIDNGEKYPEWELSGSNPDGHYTKACKI